MRRDLMKAVREVWRALGGAFDPYRPERHYMRGPGPKCRAKRAGLMADGSGHRRHRRRLREAARIAQSRRQVSFRLAANAARARMVLQQ